MTPDDLDTQTLLLRVSYIGQPIGTIVQVHKKLWIAVDMQGNRLGRHRQKYDAMQAICEDYCADSGHVV